MTSELVTKRAYRWRPYLEDRVTLDAIFMGENPFAELRIGTSSRFEWDRKDKRTVMVTSIMVIRKAGSGWMPRVQGSEANEDGRGDDGTIANSVCANMKWKRPD